MGINNIHLLSVSSALTGFGFSSTWVFTSVYMHSVLHVNLYVVGLVFTISGILAAISQIYGGRLGDRMGHKYLMILLSTASTVIYILIFYVSLKMQNAFVFSLLFVSNIVINSTIISPSNAMVSLSSRSALSGFSYLRVGNNVGWGFGPFLGGVVVDIYGYPYLYLIGVVTFLLSTLVASMLLNVRGEVTSRYKLSFRSMDPKYLFLGMSALLLFMIQGQESVTLPNFASIYRGLNAFDIGIIFFVNGLFVILLQAPISRITEKVGLSFGFVVGIFLYAIGFFSMAFDYTVLLFVISMAIATVGEDFAFPAGNAIVARLSRNKDVGLHMGVFNSFISVGRSFGPIVGGALLFYVSNAALLWFLATVSGLIAIGIFIPLVSKSVKG